MRQKAWWHLSATVAGWSSIAALSGCLLVRGVAPYPRWDALACLAAVAASALWWLWLVREGEEQQAGAPALRTTGWWPRRRSLWAAAAMTGLCVPLALLGLSAGESTPQLAQIRSGDPVIADAEVQQVHSVHRYSGKNSTSYTSTVTVRLGEAEGARLLSGEVRGKEPARQQDKVWALFAEEQPRAGSVLDTSRSELRSLLGGPAPVAGVLITVYATALCALLLVTGFLNARLKQLRKPFSASGQDVRQVPAEVTGAGAGQYLRHDPKSAGSLRRSELQPALLLHTAEGRRTLFVDRCLDAEGLAGALQGRCGRLYSADGQVPEEEPEAGRPAFLILDEQRYVYGTVTGAAGASGQQVTDGSPLPGGVHAVGPYSVWRWRVFRPLVLGLAVTFVCAVLMATGAGAGNGYGAGLLWPLVGAGVASPVAGMLLVARKVTRLLREVQHRAGTGLSDAGAVGC